MKKPVELSVMALDAQPVSRRLFGDQGARQPGVDGRQIVGMHDINPYAFAQTQEAYFPVGVFMQGPIEPGHLSMGCCNPDLVGQVVQKVLKAVDMPQPEFVIGFTKRGFGRQYIALHRFCRAIALNRRKMPEPGVIGQVCSRFQACLHALPDSQPGCFQNLALGNAGCLATGLQKALQCRIGKA